MGGVIDGVVFDTNRINAERLISDAAAFGSLTLLELEEYDAASLTCKKGYEYIILMDMSAGGENVDLWSLLDAIPVR